VPIADDPAQTSVAELSASLRGGAMSPVELVDALLARIEKHNPSLNAYVLVLAEEARAQARDSEERIRRGQARPLEGVPVAIKDNVQLRGTLTTLGADVGADRVAEVDSAVVRRLREAGAVFLGKTNLPELGTLPSTENRRFGATRNPWDTARTAGGSSGGSAAAVAAGMAPAAHGNDAGGSLRIPAACTGLFSIKPTRGRISHAPAGESAFALNAEGFITRTVRDNALLLDVASGPEPGDMFTAPPPARPFVEEAGADPGRLRIGFTATPPLDVPVDAVYLQALRDAAELCESLGHQVEEFTPPWQDDAVFALFSDLWAAYFGAKAEELVEQGGDASRLDPLNRHLHQASRQLSSAAYWRSSDRMERVVRGIVAAERGYDVLLTPALAKPPLLLGELFAGQDQDPTMPLLNAALFTPFTVSANLSGQPAANLPLFEHDGLPVGVQAIAHQGAEATLIRLAAQLEEARPWAQRRPALD
jgi:amidase